MKSTEQNAIVHSVKVYTMVCILKRMKEKMGLEAMVEYMDEYLKVIEENNPDLKKAVNNALSLMSVERMYGELKGEHNS